MPLLEGLDGVQKMSKSLGNYVGINEPPAEMFGKIMSISDDLMWRYYLLLTDLTPSQVEEKKQAVASGALHPLEAKKALARRIVGDFHSEQAAVQAQRDFESQFQQRALPSEIPEIPTPTLRNVVNRSLPFVLVEFGFFKSVSEAQRKIKEGAVYILVRDSAEPRWQRITDPTWKLDSVKYRDKRVVFRFGHRLVEAKLTW
jgi:tyrosyl-tRNA synthetase